MATRPRVEKILKALADTVRLKIVYTLSQKGGEALGSECSKRIDLTQPTLSHHYKILSDAGVISEEKVGTSKRYTICHATLEEHGIDIEKMFRSKHT